MILGLIIGFVVGLVVGIVGATLFCWNYIGKRIYG